MKHTPKILVLGGIVMDLIFDVPEWPVLRKAVQASRFVMQPGGKGLNQAIAAARLGADVSVISAIGQDHLGDLLLEELEKNGVDYQLVDRSSAADTDICGVVILNSEPGFIGGKMASQTVDARLVNRAESFIKSVDVIMATGEVPLSAVEAAFSIARKYKVTTVLNPAPPERLKNNILSLTDYIVPNEWEASIVAGTEPGGFLSTERIARKLRQAKVGNVIITTGDLGSRALIEGADEIRSFKAFDIEAVDTTGASDAFCSALAVALAQSKNIDDAVTIASAAGALSCMRFGAATSMPDKNMVNDFLKLKGSEAKLN